METAILIAALSKTRSLVRQGIVPPTAYVRLKHLIETSPDEARRIISQARFN
jgi:hypothetical protein